MKVNGFKDEAKFHKVSSSFKGLTLSRGTVSFFFKGPLVPRLGIPRLVDRLAAIKKKRPGHGTTQR